MRCSVYLLTLIGLTSVTAMVASTLPFMDALQCPNYGKAKELYKISADYRDELEAMKRLFAVAPHDPIDIPLKKHLSRTIVVWKCVCDTVKSYSLNACLPFRPALDTESCDYLEENFEELKAKYTWPRKHVIHNDDGFAAEEK
ncbi:hypothetical protein IWQ62_000032 [Dispira parvispora]|uniref:Uncharacterized protein n=1 Tax=Dispira parvispora TaxID=1520584 RepID=A0A9W8E5H4_9FUNG|nr:hypothetical protein IWQ62_000032 [Dispira parvispora]